MLRGWLCRTVHISESEVRFSEKFNNAMQNLLVIRLNTKVWGFAGPTSGQREFSNPAPGNVYLIGGKGQVYLPNLKLITSTRYVRHS
jgi:hypothetical protein